jgi:hypothetical protein
VTLEETYHPLVPAVPDVMVAAVEGATSTAQFQVTLEAELTSKVTDVSEPLAGALPEPVNPVHTYTTPPSATGLVTEVLKLPPAFTQLEPTLGVP